MAQSERESSRASPRKPRRDAKQTSNLTHQRQLAAQAEQVIDLSLADSGDPLLHNLSVHSVVPMDGKLWVRLVAEPDLNFSIAELHERLQRAAAWLRREVAAEIHRKRAPELRFEILAASELAERHPAVDPNPAASANTAQSAGSDTQV